MSGIIRFGISLESDLSKKFDARLAEKGYSNRSEAIRDLIRQDLVNQEWQKGEEIAGAITFIFDHHHRALLDKITDIQHDHQQVIVSSQHIHLDHNNCLEIVAVRGKAETVQKLANLIRALKGVKHGTLAMSSTGKKL